MAIVGRWAMILVMIHAPTVMRSGSGLYRIRRSFPDSGAPRIRSGSYGPQTYGFLT